MLGVTGSIAAYKAAELARMIRKRGWDVWVVMTEAAGKFVGELTFRTLSEHPVACDMFEKSQEWEIEHVALADRADALLIAPCTANVMAKLAHGIADDLLTCTALATEAPVIVAPAMNEKMWDHPATRQNVKTLRVRGVRVLDVGTGDLACGCRGRGRMAEPDVVMKALESVLGRRR